MSGPVVRPFAFKFYHYWATLVIRAGDRIGHFLNSKEGVTQGDPLDHIWELPGKYPIFTVVMVIYHYIERIWKILVTPDSL